MNCSQHAGSSVHSGQNLSLLQQVDVTSCLWCNAFIGPLEPRTPAATSQPPQLTPFYVEEQRLYSELLPPDGEAPPPGW